MTCCLLVLTIIGFAPTAVLGMWTVGGLSCAGFCSLNASVHADAAKTSTFRVEGMTCGGCAVGVEMAVKKLEGVHKVDASYEEKSAVVTYDPAKVKPEQIVAAIEKLGYKATLQKSEGFVCSFSPRIFIKLLAKELFQA